MIERRDRFPFKQGIFYHQDVKWKTKVIYQPIEKQTSIGKVCSVCTVRVCVCMYACVCVCVCEWERERRKACLIFHFVNLFRSSGIDTNKEGFRPPLGPISEANTIIQHFFDEFSFLPFLLTLDRIDIKLQSKFYVLFFIRSRVRGEKETFRLWTNFTFFCKKYDVDRSCRSSIYFELPHSDIELQELHIQKITLNGKFEEE